MSLLWIVVQREISPAADEIHPEVEDYRSGGTGHLEGDDSHSVVGMVPTHRLRRYREHDGIQNPDLPGHDRRIIDSIRQDIRDGKGLTNPIHLEYDHKNQWATIGEGNHRLQAAHEEGLSHVPVRVWGRAHKGGHKEDGIGAHLSLGTDFGRGDYPYVPPEIHPHHFPLLRDD